MRSKLHLIAAALLSMPLAACVSTAISNDVPRCEDLVPAALLTPVDGAALPTPARLDDGHEDARPWQHGFLDQSVQLEKANARPPAVDRIYRTCLERHRTALKRARRGPLPRLIRR